MNVMFQQEAGGESSTENRKITIINEKYEQEKKTKLSYNHNEHAQKVGKNKTLNHVKRSNKPLATGKLGNE